MGSLTKIKVFCEKCFTSISSLLSRLLFQDPWRRSFWPLISPAYLHHLSALSPPSPITSTNLAFPPAGITEVNAVTMYFCHNVFFFNSVSITAKVCGRACDVTFSPYAHGVFLKYFLEILYISNNSKSTTTQSRPSVQRTVCLYLGCLH